MARSVVTITPLTLDAFTNAMAGEAIVHAEGAIINAAGNTGKLLIEFVNTTASEKVMTVKAPASTPTSVRASRGDLAVAFAAGNSTPVVKYAVIESARFAQADGSIHIDVAASTTGFLRAYRLPRGT